MTLDRRTAQDRVSLLAAVAELLEVVDGVHAGLLVGQRDVEIALRAVVLDRDALEHQVVRVVRIDRPRLEHGLADAVLVAAALDEIDVHVDPAGHLDRAAEGDLAVALREVQVADDDAAALDIDRQVDAAAAAQVLDVAVAAVLTRRHGAGTLAPGLLERRALELAENDVLRVRRQRQRRHALRVGSDQRRLAVVPALEQLMRGQTADDAGVGQAGKAQVGNMPRGGEDAVEIPHRLGGLVEVVGQEAAELLLAEDAGIAPPLVVEHADVENIDDDDVAGLGTRHPDRPRQVVARREVDVADVVGAVVVVDLATGPVEALHTEGFAGLHFRDHRNVGVPTVDDHRLVLLGRQSLAIDANHLSHRALSPSIGGPLAAQKLVTFGSAPAHAAGRRRPVTPSETRGYPRCRRRRGASRRRCGRGRSPENGRQPRARSSRPARTPGSRCRGRGAAPPACAPAP